MPDKKIEPHKADNIGNARWQLLQWSRDNDGCLSQLPASEVRKIGQTLTEAKFSETPFGERECSVGMKVHFPNPVALREIDKLIREIYRIIVRVSKEGQFQPEDKPAIKAYLEKICTLEAESSVSEPAFRF